MSASRAKGTRHETNVVRYLNANGFPHVERRALNGSRDRGDVAGLPGVVIEAKSEKRFDLAGWLDEAVKEGRNASAAIAVVWAHRPGKSSAGDGYVIMTGAQFVALLGADAGPLPG